MAISDPNFSVRLADCPDDIAAAQRLRYDVFVAELGGAGDGVDHALGLETDRFDGHASHLLLEDMNRASGDRVVGVYRLMTTAQAAAAGGFYCASEFDLSGLTASGRKLLELGRSCLHPDYRGSTALLHLWSGLSKMVTETDTDILFGVASFHGTDTTALAQPLSFLGTRHAAPESLTVVAIGPTAVPLSQVPEDQIDRKAALRAVPALIKSYLRLGGVVGQGAFVDHAFNTTDVCLILDTTQMNARAAALYGVAP